MKIDPDEQILRVPLLRFAELPLEKIDTLLTCSRQNWQTRTDACFVVKTDRIEELIALVGFMEIWRQPPPGTVLITEGPVQKGDWFFATQLGAWVEVPPSGWGTPISETAASIARGAVGWADITKIGMEPGQVPVIFPVKTERARA